MNTKKLVKILNLVILAVILVSIFGNVYAVTDPSTLKGSDTDEFKTFGEKIIGGIQAIGSLIAVGILVVLGIKYMLGSAEEKAEYKKTMIPYIVGAILVFSASNIAGFVYKFATQNT
mgnify:CR=1 FL=1